jgi:hypothetical protein
MLEPKHNFLTCLICLACSEHFSKDVEVCKDPVGLLLFACGFLCEFVDVPTSHVL